MVEQSDFGFDGGVPYDVGDPDLSFTPPAVVEQGLTMLRDRLHLKPRQMLDPCAGAGVFGQVAREVWPGIQTSAIERRGAERPHLERHYDMSVIGDAEMVLREFARGVPFDLAATNPPFSLWAPILEAVLPRVQGVIAFLGLSTWGQSAEHAEVFERHLPRCQARVVGRVHFRGPGLNPKTGKPWGADQRDVSWWVWEVPSQGLPTWYSFNLPPLPAIQRQWTRRPGT